MTIQWNLGKVMAAVMAVESLVAVAGFWYSGEKKTALYWFFAACINSTFVF